MNNRLRMLLVVAVFLFLIGGVANSSITHAASPYPKGDHQDDWCHIGWLNVDGDVLLLLSNNGHTVFGENSAFTQCKGTIPFGKTMVVYMNYTRGLSNVTETLATPNQACVLYPAFCTGNGAILITFENLLASGHYIPCNFGVDPPLYTENWQELVAPSGKTMFTCHRNPLPE